MNRIYLALAVAAMAFPAYAQAPQADTKSKAGVSQNTQEFVKKATIGDMYEIQSSKMALDKSQNSEIKDFAQKIVDDHTKSSNELKTIVQNMQGVQIPKQLDDKHKKMMDQLQSASGAQFSQHYKKQQISAHEEAIQLYESYSKQGDNPQLKQFAAKTLPHLKQHLQMAQNLPEPSRAPGTAQAPQGGQKQAKGQSQAGGAANKVIASPGPNHIIGSDLRGTTVYGSNNEKIGEINEVVLSRNGELVAVVVGVGGFLGIGEKDVAIPFDAIEIQTAAETTGTGGGTSQKQDTGKQQSKSGQQGKSGQKGAANPQRIVLQGMTKQDLENAPKFEAKKQQQ